MEGNDPALDWIGNAYDGMSRRQFLAQVGTAGAGLAGFAAASQSVAGEVIATPADGLSVSEVPFAAPDAAVPAYAAWPVSAGRSPVVIVIPEIFGMHEHIKDVVRRFARRGYFAITFEPYAREGGVLGLPDQAAVRKVANAAPDRRVLSDLDALVAHVKAHPQAEPDRIGVTGFCRGGLYSLLFAAHSRDLRAAVAWYGQIKPEKAEGIRTEGPLDVAERIRVPVLGLYGGADQGIPEADVRELEAALRRAGKTAEFVVYPGAPHAFHADYRPSYREEPARDAWSRCVGWFDRYLAG